MLRTLPVWCCAIQIDFGLNKPLTFFWTCLSITLDSHSEPLPPKATCSNSCRSYGPPRADPGARIQVQVHCLSLTSPFLPSSAFPGIIFPISGTSWDKLTLWEPEMDAMGELWEPTQNMRFGISPPKMWGRWDIYVQLSVSPWLGWLPGGTNSQAPRSACVQTE